MKKADLPTEKATEPEVGATLSTEPEVGATLSVERKKNHTIDFDEATVKNEGCFSQQTQLTSSYSEALSLPTRYMSHRERMLWMQKRRVTGLWVQCDDCKKWRYMPHIHERHELPKKWYCKMNPDTSLAECSAPEKTLSLREEEDVIYNEYSAGSLVWARLQGWPWWPAMVDDCPDTEQYYWLDGFSDMPEDYHVVFFDVKDVTRAWISTKDLRPFVRNDKVCLKGMSYDKVRIEEAIKLATDAESMPMATRLEKYSFIARYKGNINTPRKPSVYQLQKFKNEIERKFNIEYPLESSSDDETPANFTRAPKKNISMNNTPKKPKEAVNSDQNVNSMKEDVGKLQEALRSTEFNNDTSKTYLTQSGRSSEVRKARMSTESSDFDF